MKLVLICLLLLVVPKAFADSVPVEVTAKIVEMPKKMIYCGYIKFRAVVRYEVITVDKGTFASKELLAVETCPENLRVGMQRRLALKGPAKKGSYVDDIQRPGPRWEAVPR